MSVLPNYKLEYEKQPQDELKEIAKDHAKDLYEFVQDGLEANSEEVMLAIHAPEDTLIGQYTRSLILQVDTSQDYYNYGYQIIINGFETEVARYFEDAKDAEDGILNALEYYLQEKTDYYQIYNDLKEELYAPPAPKHGSIDKSKVDFYLDKIASRIFKEIEYGIAPEGKDGELRTKYHDSGALSSFLYDMGDDDPFVNFCKSQELKIYVNYVGSEYDLFYKKVERIKELRISIDTDDYDVIDNPKIKETIKVEYDDAAKIKSFVKDVLKKAIYKYDFDKYLKESKIRKMRSRRMFKEATNKVISYDDWQEAFDELTIMWSNAISYLSKEGEEEVVYHDTESTSKIFGEALGIWIAGYGKVNPEDYEWEPFYGKVSVGLCGGKSEETFDGGFKEENWVGSSFDNKLENALLQMLKKEFGIVVEVMEHAYTESRLRSRNKRIMVRESREDEELLREIKNCIYDAVQEFFSIVGIEYFEEDDGLLTTSGYAFTYEDGLLAKHGIKTISFQGSYEEDDIDTLLRSAVIIDGKHFEVFELGRNDNADIISAIKNGDYQKILDYVKRLPLKESKLKRFAPARRRGIR